jgi:HSP20 family protein
MLTLWDPFAELNRVHRRLFPAEWSEALPEFRPSVDIYEKEEAFHIKADLAGVKPDDVKIELHHNVLTVSGERKLEMEDEKNGYRRVERRYGNFSRSFTLPETVDSGKIDADIKEGVLTVILPKRAESKPRAIEVKAH